MRAKLNPLRFTRNVGHKNNMKREKTIHTTVLALLCLPGVILFAKAFIAPDSNDEWAKPVGIIMMLTILSLVLVPVITWGLFRKGRWYALIVQALLIAGLLIGMVKDILSTNTFGMFFVITKACVYVLGITSITFFASWAFYTQRVPQKRH